MSVFSNTIQMSVTAARIVAFFSFCLAALAVVKSPLFKDLAAFREGFPVVFIVWIAGVVFGVAAEKEASEKKTD